MSKSRPKLADRAKPDLSARPRPDLASRDLSVRMAAYQAPEPDPLAGIPEGLGLEEEIAAESDALLSAFQARAKREQDRFTLATDSEYWFAVCFQSREQKEAFLAALNWLANGDKYLDGPVLAKQMGISIPKVELPGRRPVDRSYAGLSLRKVDPRR